MADETKTEEKKPEPFKPITVKAKVQAHYARGSVTVEHKEHGTFNVVTAFDQDPPKIGDEIEVKINSIVGQIVGGKAVNTVEHAEHVRTAKK